MITTTGKILPATTKLVRTPDTALDPVTLEVIDTLSAEYERARAAAEEAEATKKQVAATLQSVLEGLDAKSIATTAYKVTHIKKAGNWYLDEKKLLINGVDPEVIAASKSQGNASEYVKVSQNAKGYTPEVVRRGPEDQTEGASGVSGEA